MGTIIQWIIVLAIIIYIASRFMPVKGIENITATQAKQKCKDKNVQFIDVRTPGEYQRNHRKPFQNIPLYELKQRSSDLSKDRETVVICQSGLRSAKAAKILKKQGFRNISNVKGGMSAWL
ncbi:rhodanese-like domain-containing protein [Virgibacillus halophilus]|uniref:Rhodanese-like domain-containing protein n=1 Tax=Tigheibacillus halophilus TaxID=361280 RepID=A0ABU5C9R3_9BACI|nr:rhodanese-like domain-containing protein [Virgibacillus halophilus]